jgi:hypothetical protein
VFVVSRSVSNIICSVIFGRRFDYEDERLLTIIRFINDNFKIMSSPWGEVSRLSSAGDGVRGPQGPGTDSKQPVGKRQRSYWPRPFPSDPAPSCAVTVLLAPPIPF